MRCAPVVRPTETSAPAGANRHSFHLSATEDSGASYPHHRYVRRKVTVVRPDFLGRVASEPAENSDPVLLHTDILRHQHLCPAERHIHGDHRLAGLESCLTQVDEPATEHKDRIV